ncbi:hypothetical protein AAVH_20802 [Aphelenchoides avenae]|nr:hypothetical protein AAVH_20802 [Aphelenchus avenae]
MLPEILLESLRFMDRASLEACQLVSRKCNTTIDKSNPTLALRPMDALLILGLPPFEAAQALVIAQEMAARTRNLHVDRLCVECLECVAQLIAPWRDTDDGLSCTVSSIVLHGGCTLTIDVKALLQPLISAKLGVTSYEVAVHAIDEEAVTEFDALWTAYDGRMAQSLKYYAYGRQAFLGLIDRMLAEPAHGGRHYSLIGWQEKLQRVVENYVKTFETAHKQPRFPPSVFIGNYAGREQSMCTLRRRQPHILEKPPALRNWPPRKSKRLLLPHHFPPDDNVFESFCHDHAFYNGHTHHWSNVKHSSYHANENFAYNSVDYDGYDHGYDKIGPVYNNGAFDDFHLNHYNS